MDRPTKRLARLRRSSPDPSLIIALLLSLLVAGCASSGGGLPGVDPALASAPDRVTVAGVTLRLDTELWRDLMPGPGRSQDGSGLIARVTVFAADSSSAVTGLTLTRMWAIDREESWVSRLEETTMDGPSWLIQGTARDGPRWPVEIRVDVVVELRDRAGDLHLLRARNQHIRAVY